VRGIDAHTLRRVIEAIHTGQALEVEYQPLSNPARVGAGPQPAEQ